MTCMAQTQGLFEKHMKDYEPADPMYETYVDKKGKTRRRKVRVRFTFATGVQWR